MAGTGPRAERGPAWTDERYKRFYFRDIQCITILKTNAASAWSWILGTLCVCSAGLFGLIAMNADPSNVGGELIAGGILTACWLAMLLVNLLGGPSCTCSVRTAVQTQALPSITRVAKAERAIRVLKPLIEQVQGALSAAEIMEYIQASAATPPPAPMAQEQAARPAATPPPPVRLGPADYRVHTALFIAMLLDAGAGFFKHIDMGWKLYFGVSAALLAAVCGLSIAALVRQRKSGISEGLRLLTGFTFGGLVAMLFGICVYGIMFRMQYAMHHYGRLPGHVDFYPMGGFKVLSLITDAIEAGMGIAGLAMILSDRRARVPVAGAAGAETRQEDQTEAVP